MYRNQDGDESHISLIVGPNDSRMLAACIVLGNAVHDGSPSMSETKQFHTCPQCVCEFLLVWPISFHRFHSSARARQHGWLTGMTVWIMYYYHWNERQSQFPIQTVLTISILRELIGYGGDNGQRIPNAKYVRVHQLWANDMAENQTCIVCVCSPSHPILPMVANREANNEAIMEYCIHANSTALLWLWADPSLPKARKLITHSRVNSSVFLQIRTRATIVQHFYCIPRLYLL